MRFDITVTVEVERVSGKFVSRDDIENELIDAVEQADPSSIDVDESEYEVTDWAVTVAAPPRKTRKVES